MLNIVGIDKVYLSCGNTDLRKSVDGLAAIVQQEFKLDPFSTSLFVFCNKARDKIKILQWEHNGFWLYYRRLENGKFQWPMDDSMTIGISQRELRWLLDGLSIKQKNAHTELLSKTVI